MGVVSAMLDRVRDHLRVEREVARDALVGFAFLFVTISGHVMVEAARDALFLAGIPAARLPWAYLCIALLALAVARISRNAAAQFPRTRILTATSLLGAAVTAVFWLLCRHSNPAILFALYVWVGLLATAVTIQFWVVFGGRMAPGTARRVFAFVAMGALAGGVLGAAAASVVASVGAPRDLLLCGAVVLAGAGILPEYLSRTVEASAGSATRRSPGLSTPQVLRDGYVRTLLVLVVLTTIATTGIDFLFKSVAQRSVPPESLARFFASFYTGVNLVALIVQLVATRRLILLFGPGGTLAALPSIGLVGAALTSLAAGFLPIAALKGADGALRHSLHRTSTEVLFVPLPGGMRGRARALAGSLGHRGGQAFGSVLILASLALNVDITAVAWFLCAVCAAWFLAVRSVGLQYSARVARRSGRTLAGRLRPPRALPVSRDSRG